MRKPNRAFEKVWSFIDLHVPMGFFEDQENVEELRRQLSALARDAERYRAGRRKARLNGKQSAQPQAR